MKLNISGKPAYIYTYTCRDDEVSLCNLEIRSVFGCSSQNNIVESPLLFDPSRSPFIRERVDVLYEGTSLQDMNTKVEGLDLEGATFRVNYVKHDELTGSARIRFKERRTIERTLGLHIRGLADLSKPERVFGIMYTGGRWVFGDVHTSEAIWLKHQWKPQGYSTALSTRVARAVVNIAIPNPSGIQAIDPCCGIGTVLVEALSMGISILGRDINPLIVRGARENIAYFGLNGEVVLGAIEDITKSYDVAIIDMPYNLCSVISPEEQLSMLRSARRITDRVVIISMDPIDHLIEQTGFAIIDRCKAIKGNFTRQIMVCH